MLFISESVKMKYENKMMTTNNDNRKKIKNRIIDKINKEYKAQGYNEKLGAIAKMLNIKTESK